MSYPPSPPFPGQPAPSYPQQPQGYPPQPSYPQQPQGASAWPPAPAQPQWGGPPAGPMPGPQAAPPQQLSAPPSLPQVDQGVIAAAYQRARDEQARLMSGSGGGSKFLSLAPPGVKDWTMAPIGAVVQRRVFLVPSKVPGALPFMEDFTHFWKGGSKPQGNSVACLGPDRCPVCIGRELVQRNVPDENFKKHIRDKSKVRRQIVYQVLSIDNPQEHQHEDGSLSPLFVRVGLDAHNAIGEKLGLKGLHTFFDAQHARPIVITKRKTGASTLDIETTIDDLDPMDVHPWFWNVLANTHDFAEIARPTDAQKYALACQEMGLPMQDPAVQQALSALAASGAPAQGQASYNPNASPPNTSPYQQPTFGGAAANVQQWQTGPGHTGNTGPQPMQNQQWQGPPAVPQQPPAQPQQQSGYYGAPQGYPQQGPQVPANVPPGLAHTMIYGR